MTKKSKYIFSIITASILIGAGGLVYLLFRPLSLVMFRWLGLSESNENFMMLRESVAGSIPSWAIYVLPDGLWACSYVIFICILWNFQIKKCWPWAIIIPMIGILSELGQAFGIVPGVFDPLDLLSYSFGAVAGFLFVEFFLNRNILNHNNLNKI